MAARVRLVAHVSDEGRSAGEIVKALGSLEPRSGGIWCGRVREQEMAVMRRARVTLSQVAERAGVSRSSVSYVLNDPDRVAVATRERVRAAMAELGYQTNVAARQLARGRSDVLGLVLPDASNPFFAELAVEVEIAAAEHGLFVVHGNSRQDEQRELEYVQFFHGLQVAGLLISPVAELPAMLSSDRPPVPFVLFGDQQGPFASITGDSHAAGRLAVKHLLDQGRRDLVFVGGGSARQHGARFAGASEQIAVAGRGRLRFVEIPDLSMAAGAAAARSLLSGEQLPDGVFAANDVVAIGVIQEFLRDGVVVPDQISVVGYDDIPFAASAIVPLTTIRTSRTQLARAAIRMLLDQVEGRELPPVQQVFDAELIVRDSTVGSVG